MSEGGIEAHQEILLVQSKTSGEGVDPEPQISNVEKDMSSRGNASGGLELDSTGLPLAPQPSRFKDDPLVSNASSCSTTLFQ